MKLVTFAMMGMVACAALGVTPTASAIPVPSQYVCTPGGFCAYAISYQVGSGDCDQGNPWYQDYNVVGTSFFAGTTIFLVAVSADCSAAGDSSTGGVGAGVFALDTATFEFTSATAYWRSQTANGETTCRAGVSAYGLQPIPNGSVEQATPLCPPPPPMSLVPL